MRPLMSRDLVLRFSLTIDDVGDAAITRGEGTEPGETRGASLDYIGHATSGMKITYSSGRETTV